MEFYIPDIPASANSKQIKASLAEVFRKHYIFAFDLYHWNNRRNRNVKEARIVIHDFTVAEEIFRKYHTPPPRNILRGTRIIKIKSKAAHPILIHGSAITLMKSTRREPIPEHLIKALKAENTRKMKQATERAPPTDRPYKKTIPFEGFEVGVWTTDPRDTTLPMYSSFYHSKWTGNFRLTRAAVQVELTKHQAGTTTKQYILCLNSTVRHAMVVHESPGAAYFIISLSWAPKFYEKEVLSQPGLLDPLDPLISFYRNMQKSGTKFRVSSLDEKHANIAPYCFVYRFRLKNPHDAQRILSIGSIQGFFDVSEERCKHQWVTYDFQKSMAGLHAQLEAMPFSVAFQLQTLVYNGILLPHRVKELLGAVREALKLTFSSAKTEDVVSSVLKSWVDGWKPQSPTDNARDWLTDSIILDFKQTLERKEQSTEYMLLMKFHRKENQVLIHRVMITPTGIYASGPNLEPKNRVLRQYSEYLNHFIRVTLVDEDGGDLRFERGVDGRKIYDERFLPCLMPGSDAINIAGRRFNFLGFSQSSLRSHTAWFMADIWDPKRGWITVDRVIRSLGDFGTIRFPGKCAARIGQAFTDTVANIKVEAGIVTYRRDIKRRAPDGKEYTFSDGCGTISPKLLDLIVKKGGFDTDRFLPTIFQIRFKGAKGVVSLDNRIRDVQMNLRDSMVKFEAQENHNTFEICMSITKPLQLYLNRHLIKVLEDRGVPKENFIKLQNEALSDLREMTLSADHAAYFLQYQSRCIQAEIPFLIRELYQQGWNYQEDKFLRQVVEFSLLNTLREMKYRARIPVQKGFTLIGILDETGYLDEGEIYCPIKKEGEQRWALKGRVAICKSPSLHPGDVQVVKAIEVALNSPLRELTNCVVFSQRGNRDLPNMLSGGDLDGDLYHVWWDPRLMPTRPAEPAEYATGQKGQELDRPVTQVDIAKFFLDFMRNDRLGAISIAHIIHADQSPIGVYSEECLKCAQLASKAVDFPKTGVPVAMNELPRTPNARPDFLAPSPQVNLHSGGKVKLLHQDHDDSDDDEDYSNPTSPVNLNVVDADDPFTPVQQFLYYESKNALGHLFRAIDEEKFIKAWENTAERYESHGPNHLLQKVQQHMIHHVDMKKVGEVYEFAKHLRISYEQNMRDLAQTFATTRRNEPLSEVETFIGCIIGTESHRQSRYQRDCAESLRGEVNRLITQVMARIRHGSEKDVVEDGRYDGRTLERAMACVFMSLTARDDGEEGRSFGWLATAVGLKELSRRGIKVQTEDLAERMARMMVR
ncbi:hypothetical protein H072_539 [Dactylellina haptotyla CBS 200.50]|uniref:RNA-dependent RNA polymerase n=1 Tax=Dactylellina haptotyla (strain CBS 200.50) TaxID=1284197 RepID=S8ARL9_DACHA|nr:hypothetical protein H072_539 [Dactylellina haptotyla CBS 200.50]